MDTTVQHDPKEEGTETGRSPALALSAHGGLGEDALGKRNHRSNSDVRIMARAIREEWDITPEKRAEVLDTLMHEMRHSDSAHLRIMAAKAIVAANAQNIAARNEGKPGGHTHIENLQQIIYQVARGEPLSLPDVRVNPMVEGCTEGGG